MKKEERKEGRKKRRKEEGRKERRKEGRKERRSIQYVNSNCLFKVFKK